MQFLSRTYLALWSIMIYEVVTCKEDIIPFFISLRPNCNTLCPTKVSSVVHHKTYYQYRQYVIPDPNTSKTSTRNWAGVRDPHVNYGHQRDNWSVVVAEAKPNNTMWTCVQCTHVQLFVLYCWSIPGARLASLEVLLTILKEQTECGRSCALLWRILCQVQPDAGGDWAGKTTQEWV